MDFKEGYLYKSRGGEILKFHKKTLSNTTDYPISLKKINRHYSFDFTENGSFYLEGKHPLDIVEEIGKESDFPEYFI